ncbi:MAG: penicillin acylase family protein [Sneathiellaceae bacterium]
MTRLAMRFAAVLGAALALTGCSVLAPLPDPADTGQRLAAFPVDGLPLQQPVTLYWNDRAVPFIEARTDHDAAMALGLVHAHLRLGQMELLRHVSQGRLAEIGGPLAIDIDTSLRILDYGRAAPAIVASLPAESRAWLDAYLAGVNHYQANVRPLPHEFTLMGKAPEPWTAEDVITIGRLASTDVNWLVWFRLLEMRRRADWPAVWQRLVREGSSSAPSYDGEGHALLGPMQDLMTGFSKTGSNVVVVGGAHSRSGAALIASDPHLGLLLPNTWLLVGMKSPSFHMVGMMVPGLPFMALGRNPDIAWGGTNLRSANSDLFDISGLPASDITVRREPLAVRWWFDRELQIRETRFGPVISDAPMLPMPDGEMLALRWIGHDASDELTAMLRMNRARNWEEFTAAMSGFAISAQNMLYADRRGHIGQVMATHLPTRPQGPPADLALPPERLADWDAIVTSADLPQAYDPPAGFIASANNRGAEAAVPVGWFFSADDRVLRLQALVGRLIAGGGKLDAADLMAVQQDVYMASAAALNAALLARIDQAGIVPPAGSGAARVLAGMRGWDGHFTADSAGAVAYSATVANFLPAFYGEGDLAVVEASGRLESLVAADLAAAPPGILAGPLQAALDGAAGAVDSFATWGEMHRLALRHPMGLVPVLGERYRIGDHPAAGSSQTVMKSAHGITAERHDTRYGANARHVSDLADPNANWFVLLGGQDGWLNNANFADQVELWQAGEYIQIPMELPAVRAAFQRRTILQPGPAARPAADGAS